MVTPLIGHPICIYNLFSIVVTFCQPLTIVQNACARQVVVAVGTRLGISDQKSLARDSLSPCSTAQLSLRQCFLN